MNLDKKDRAILVALCANGRAKISDLSDKTGLPRDTVHYRLTKLEKEQYVAFEPDLNYTKVGFPFEYRIEVKIRSTDLKREQEFINFLMVYPRVIHLEQLTGNWDLTFWVVATNPEDFGEHIKEIRTKFSDVILDHQINNVTKVLKVNAYAGLLG